jgi:predicted acyltransferase
MPSSPAVPANAATDPVSGPTVPSAAAPGSSRLMSVDALRGFDMMWIIGAAAVARALDRMGDSALLQVVAAQLVHPDWEGFTFFDLIFPLFIFIVGVSIVFSLRRTLEQEGRPAVVRRVVRRAILLFLLGIFYGGGFSRPFEEIRWVGVLQRIALCYFFASLLFCYLRPRALITTCVSLIAGYWALMTFVPVPGFGAGSYEEGQNLANWLDHQLLPGRLYRDTWDPEGILSTLPAIATCLLGIFAGLLLREGAMSASSKTRWLIGAGLASLLLGWLWGLQFPINKHIWTSSFVLVTGGLSAILLGIFHQVIDVWGWRRWSLPFVWIGMNAITIYMAHNLMRFGEISRRLVGGDIQAFLNARLPGLGELMVAIGMLALSFLFCWFLHRRRIFLRL